MKGEVLNVSENGGVVLSVEDGKRYNLVKNTTESNEVLTAGQKIDFRPDNGNATEVYIIKTEAVSASLNLGSVEAVNAGKTSAIGAGINILSAIPGLGILFSIAGTVVEFIGIHKLGKLAQKPQIFSHMLWGEILGIIGTAIGTFVGIAGVGLGIIGGSGTGMGIGYILSLIIMLVFGIASSIQVFKGLSKLSLAYNIGILKTAAWLYIVGILTVPLGIGLFLLIAYQICKIIGYMQIK